MTVTAQHMVHSSSTTRRPRLLTLPSELLNQLLANVNDAFTLLQLARTNRKLWGYIIGNEMLWFRLCLHVWKLNITEQNWVDWATRQPLESALHTPMARWLRRFRERQELERRWKEPLRTSQLKCQTAYRRTAMPEIDTLPNMVWDDPAPNASLPPQSLEMNRRAQPEMSYLQSQRRNLLEDLSPVATGASWSVFLRKQPARLFLLAHQHDHTCYDELTMLDEDETDVETLTEAITHGKTLIPLPWGPAQIDEQMMKRRIQDESWFAILHESHFVIEFLSGVPTADEDHVDECFMIWAWRFPRIDEILSLASFRPVYSTQSTVDQVPYELHGRWLIHADTRKAITHGQEVRHDGCLAETDPYAYIYHESDEPNQVFVIVDLQQTYCIRWIARHPLCDYHIHRSNSYDILEYGNYGRQNEQIVWLYYHRFDVTGQKLTWQLLELDNEQTPVKTPDGSSVLYARVLRKGTCLRNSTPSSQPMVMTSCTRLNADHVMLFSELAPDEDQTLFSQRQGVLSVHHTGRNQILWECTAPAYQLSYYLLLPEHMLLVNVPLNGTTIYIVNLQDGSILHEVPILSDICRLQHLFGIYCLLTTKDNTLSLLNMKTGEIQTVRQWVPIWAVHSDTWRASGGLLLEHNSSTTQHHRRERSVSWDAERARTFGLPDWENVSEFPDGQQLVHIAVVCNSIAVCPGRLLFAHGSSLYIANIKHN